MKKFTTLIVALAMVFTLASTWTVKAGTGRDNLTNKAATNVAVKWHQVGFDRDGSYLNPSNLDPATVTRGGADGTEYQLFPWQKIGQQVWGRASTNTAYELPRLLPTTGFSPLGRTIAANRDYNNNYTMNSYAYWTEFFLTVTPNAGGSQEYAHWYAVLDKEGNLWLDPDGVFHNCAADPSADPMFWIQSLRIYEEGSCLYNPKGMVDPLPNNNTQGPYKMIFTDPTTMQEIYFWWKFDTYGNLVDRVWRIGWADINDFNPMPNGTFDATNPFMRSVVSYRSAYDPFLKTTVAQSEIDWDYKLNLVDFAPVSNPAIPWPNLMEGAEVYFDANGNTRFDPYEPVYRKSTGNNANLIQINDIRCVNMSVAQGAYIANYKHDTTVTNIDYDLGRVIRPINHVNAPAGTPIFQHTSGQMANNPNVRYEYDEFIYQKNSTYTQIRTTITVGMLAGDTIINVSSTAGFVAGDRIVIHGTGLDTHELRTVGSIISGTQMSITASVTNPHPAGYYVARQSDVDFNDIRLSPVNHRFNNSSDSRNWLGSYNGDALVLLEVLNGGCYTEMYNITVETDIWDGMVPSQTAAALRTPNGDIVAAAQRIQMTTVLDPTGLEFRVPATVFENIKFQYREYLGIEIFKDDGLNNNLGSSINNTDVVRASLSDDYAMWSTTEEFIGAQDEETAKDYSWSIATRPFFADEMYIDLNGDGFVGNGEPMYRDVDVSATISAGDIRINDIKVDNTLSIIAYAAGSIVTAGDIDVAMRAITPIWTLRSIPLSVRYNDQQHGCEPPNRTYDIGEPIYFNPALASNMTVLYSNNFNGVASPPWPNTWDPANWTLVNHNTSVCGANRSWSDPNQNWGVANETMWNFNPASPTGSAAAEFLRGTAINNTSMVSGTTQTFTCDVFYRPENWSGTNPWGDNWFNAMGIIFGYLNDRNFYCLYTAPNYDDTGFGFMYSPNCTTSNWLDSLDNYTQNSIAMRVVRVVNGQVVFNINLPTYTWTNWGSPVHYEIIMASPTSVILNLSSFGSQVDLTSFLQTPGWQLPGTGFGYTMFGEDGVGFGVGSDYWDDNTPAYIDNVMLFRPAPGISGNIVRLTDVWVGDAYYPAGSQVLAGDFYRIKNPVYGVSTGNNCSKRYMDAEILPGQIGLKVEITPKLKVEQTSHIKVTTTYPIEGEYVAGKVVGDKRTRLYYRPDSFILNTIPSQYQAVYSSREEAELNFFKPDMSVKGDVVYVSLRSTDFTEQPATGLNSIREMYEKVAIIDAKNPVVDWQFTPYRGTILDDIGQEMPVLIKAYLDKGGVTNCPTDSRFTNSINFNNSATRTTNVTTNAYYTQNYIDPWHMNRKWETKEAYNSYYNQAYTRACRVVYSPYEVDKVSACALGDRYDCFGMEKVTVEPEGINLIPTSPCVDPLSYRYPNITLTLQAFDNPDDVNDPAGYNMAVAPGQTKTTTAIATYNVNGAGIRYMCMAKRWNRYGSVNQNTFYIIQVHDDGSWLPWTLSEPLQWTAYPQIIGVLDPNDAAVPGWGGIGPFGTSNFSARGTNVYDVGDADCSVGSGSKDICGTGFPPLGDVNQFDTYATMFDPANPYLGNGEIYHYGVYSYVTHKNDQTQGGLMSVVCQPINSNSKLNIRVHTTNVVLNYNSVQQPFQEINFLADNISAVHQAVQSNGANTFTPYVSADYKTNPPAIRYMPTAETIDYCDVISLKVLPPDLEVNFNNIYMIDRALQQSNIGNTGSQLNVTNGNALNRNDDPKRWVLPDYNPFCTYRPLSSDINTDVRCYPGGQTHAGRVAGNDKQAGINAYPALWRKQFGKLGSEFHPLTDYGLFFELSSGRLAGQLLSFATGTVNRIEVKGPFMTPVDLDPAMNSVKYRSGTAFGSTLGYSYKGLRFVPIKYDYTGKIVVSPLNYTTYELGANDYQRIISPACTTNGDRITNIKWNTYLQVGKELDYTRVNRPGGVRVFVFDELIPVGPGRITITVWLTNGVKKVFQDCCVAPPADGIDVSGIEITGMPEKVTVDSATDLKLKLTEGYGIKSEGPPVEYGLGPQDTKECNDAFVYVWQDRGVIDPIDGLYNGAGDGYPTKPPQSTDITSTYNPFNPEDDVNGDGIISFKSFETEIMGKYDIATSTWDGGVIDARTFHRQNGDYMFKLDGDAMPTTVGLDFGQKGAVVTPDHVIADDEMLDITVTAYKYGDDNNDRTFRPFWGGRTNNTERVFSHEVYLAGQVAAPVEAKPDLLVEITPNILTAGVQSELVDPTMPLTFTLKDASQQPIDLSIGVPDARGETLLKIDPMWYHCFKDPHPDDAYYFGKDKNLPQYYWLRTDLHNDDYSAISNKRLYSWPRNPFLPIKYSYNGKEGKYVFGGFVANDKGKFEVHIYTPDRKHKAVANVTVELPKVSYELFCQTIDGQLSPSTFVVPGNAGDPDFVMTSVDFRMYTVNATIKTAEGKLIQGLAQSTSVCEGGGGMYARWTPFYTREEHFNWVAAPSTTLGNFRRATNLPIEYNYWLTSNGGREYQYIAVDLNNNSQLGDAFGELFTLGAQWNDNGIRVNGKTGVYATYYPTINRIYDDGTYARYQSWDGPFNKISAMPEGYGCGSIYNNPYEELYMFADVSRDFRLTYRDSFNINNRGQGRAFIFADDSCKYGVLVGVSEWGMLPEFSDVYGGAQPYSDPYMPQKTITRFVHSNNSAGDLGTNDGAYFLDWDAMPDKYVESKYPRIIAKWAENGQEISKQYLSKDNYDLAYGIENHLLLEVLPADSRDLPVFAGNSLNIGTATNEHIWGANQHETWIYGSILPSPINPRARVCQIHYTPTGTGRDISTIHIYNAYVSSFWPHMHAYEVIKFDTIMSLQIVADSPEPLKVGKAGKLVVIVEETASNPNQPNVVEGATVHIKGAGVEAEKKTNKEGKAEFSITPTERGRIVITASVEGMKDTYSVVFVENYVAPPMLDISPVAPVIASNSITIDGRTNEGCKVTVNGKPASVDEKGQFKSTIKLNPGINNVVVVATNALGQSVTKVIKIESKTQPSGIIVDKLGEFENVTQIRIRGHVEPDTKVEVTNETNGSKGEVSVVNDVFVCDINVVPGENKFTIKATDKVGQTSTYNPQLVVYVWTKKSVKIQTNSRVAVVDGVPVTMATAPVINKNNTFVPLADIVASLVPGTSQPTVTGNTVSVSFGIHKLDLTLNQVTATLDGSPYTLKAAPFSANGVVMFPLANLTLLNGNEPTVTVEVLNDAATKTITITRRW